MISILIIEDDEDLVKLIKHHFKSEVGLSFNYASSYLEGLAKIAERTYDLYLLDINLDQGKSGFDILKLLQKERDIDNRVIITSRTLDERTKIQGYDLGTSNFVPKPISFELLRSVMKKNIRMLQNQEVRNIQIGPYRLDTGLQQLVTVEEQKQRIIPLTSTEFKILLRLCRNLNTIVEKQELCFSGRDPLQPMSFKSLEMHIASLRKKLGVNVPIKTKRDAGYYIDSKSISS